MLVRVDANSSLGLGHVQRCLALASALRRLGAAPHFLMNTPQAIHDRVRAAGFPSDPLETDEAWDAGDRERTTALAESRGCRLVVVDSDHEGEDYLWQLRCAGFFVVAIEDLVPHPFPCQVVVNGDAHAEQLPYRSSSGDTLFLLGLRYTILRDELWDVLPRPTPAAVRNVLVILGGADPFNLMPEILAALAQVPGPFCITAVVGPFYRNLKEVASAAEGANHRIRLVHSPRSVRSLMLEADLAVCAGGQTLYELARVGCPTVAVRVAANQDGTLQDLAERGIVRFVGRAEERGVVSMIADAVASLLHDRGTRGAMAAAGRQLVDGRGALRVAERVLAESRRVRDIS